MTPPHVSRHTIPPSCIGRLTCTLLPCPVFRESYSKKIVDSLFDIIKDELIQSNDVMILGFGKWFVKKKSARNGRNPQSGKSMIIGARKVVTFKGSAKLRDKINSRY